MRRGRKQSETEKGLEGGRLDEVEDDDGGEYEDGKWKEADEEMFLDVEDVWNWAEREELLLMMIHDLFFLSLNKSSLSRKLETSDYDTNVYTNIILVYFR